MTGNSFGTDPMALSTRRAQSFYGDDHSRYAVDWAYGFNKNGRCSFVSDGNLPQRWAGLDAVGTIHRSGADGGRFDRADRRSLGRHQRWRAAAEKHRAYRTSGRELGLMLEIVHERLRPANGVDTVADMTIEIAIGAL